ncbi:MAG: hypothetical protein NTY14_00780 [Candidatus Omnitrophica bacterium]|nr:hypothetical protein [Candidatus Omnitrophota bacterium]
MNTDLVKLIKAVYERWKAKLPKESGAHPDEQDFIAFVQNQLPPQETVRIKEHILSCDTCSQILAATIKLQSVQELEPPEKLLDESRALIDKAISSRILEIMLQAKERMLNLINTSGDVLVGQELIPAAVLRSRKISDFKDEVTILKDFGDIRVEVKITAKESNNFDLKVIMKNKQSQEIIKDLRVSLIKGDLELESYLAESGKVVFEHVLLGKYTVEISSLRDNVASILIDIKV